MSETTYKSVCRNCNSKVKIVNYDYENDPDSFSTGIDDITGEKLYEEDFIDSWNECPNNCSPLIIDTEKWIGGKLIASTNEVKDVYANNK